MQPRHQLTVHRDRLLSIRKNLLSIRKNLQDALRELEYELDDNLKALKEMQANCVHVEEWYAEGRHGSDKGTNYYRCKICDFHWDDSE